MSGQVWTNLKGTENNHRRAKHPVERTFEGVVRGPACTLLEIFLPLIQRTLVLGTCLANKRQGMISLNRYVGPAFCN